jgi:hypothetical protein
VIYARLPRPPEDAGLTLSGQVRGPRCFHAETLPLTTPLVDLGPGPTNLAKAIVTDPVFWSPELPAIYDVTVNLHRGAEIMATARREIGLRSLGVRGRGLVLGGKNWVLRGVSTRSTCEEWPQRWHDSSAAIVVDDDIDADWLGAASESGALIVVYLFTVADVRALSHLPGAAIAIFCDLVPPEFEPALAPNILVGQLAESDDAHSIDPRAELVVVGAHRLLRSNLAQSIDKPVIVSRRLESPRSVAEARAACDALQRDLAPLGQFAGYIV